MSSFTISEPDIDSLVNKLTLKEKASLLSGADSWTLRAVKRLGIPSVRMADGPHGLRRQKQGAELSFWANYPATCFPSAVTLASAWDPDLVEEVAGAIAEEAISQGVDIVLAPGTNIKRSPLGGRNFEYYSEDPILSGLLAASFIMGLQNKGVGASLKHFAANNQETRRFVIDARIDQTTLNEIYLKPFEIAVKVSKPWTLMAAYNRLNGSYCTENRWLLQEKLRDEWGFDGAVVSDWGAVGDRIVGLKAGLDIEMPGFPGDGKSEIIRALKDGRIEEYEIDNAVRNVLKLIIRCSSLKKRDAPADLAAHHKLAAKAACAGSVLLKNDNGALPITSAARLAIIGAFAKRPRYQGAGSSIVNPTMISDAFAALNESLEGTTELIYAEGYNFADGNTSEPMLAEALSAACSADACVVFAGLPASWETEGMDRKTLDLPEGHSKIIEAVASVNKRTIVVLMNGGPVLMPWLDKVSAVLETYLGGQAGGLAIAEILLGLANPSGKLAETFPKRLVDNPSYGNFPGDGRMTRYEEGILVGYRYYEENGRETLFPFGHGLSYSSFSFEDLKASLTTGQETIDVSFKVMNTGAMRGCEVAQVYLSGPLVGQSGYGKRLVAFKKVELEPGELRHVSLTIHDYALTRWNEDGSGWFLPQGDYELMVGSSSTDVRMVAKVKIEGVLKVSAPDRIVAQSDQVITSQFSDYGQHGQIRRNRYDMNTPVIDLGGPIGRALKSLLRWLLRLAYRKAGDDPTAANIEEVALQMPIRSLAFSTQGVLSKRFIRFLLFLMNRQGNR